MITTLADKLLAADDDYATLIDTIIDTAIAAKDRAALNMSNVRALARTKALTLAAAWHEVNGATLRADEDALTRARADLAAERKAWQEATEMVSPPAAKGRIDLLIGDLTRARDCRSSLIGAREQAEQERNVAVVARGLAETAAKEAITRAEAAEREVARLTGAGVASDDDLDVVYAHASDDGDNDAGGRRAVYNLGLARGRAAPPPPDASDEEIARALYAATVVPGAYDDLPWSVTEPRQRAGWIAAVTTVIRPRLDALRAEVDRLTTALATAEEARDVAQAAARFAYHAPPPTPSPRFVAVTRDEVNGRPVVYLRSEVTASNLASSCNADPSMFVEDGSCYDVPAYTHAVVDTVATPPAALPQVEAFELPAVEWTEEVGGGAERSVGARHRAVACGDGSWRLTIDGKTASSAESKARVEAAVALLAGRAEVRR